MHTTHFSIIDADGNMVAVTLTVNTHVRLEIRGAGNRLSAEQRNGRFCAGAEQAQCLRFARQQGQRAGRGKRMLSSMSPSIVIGADRTGVIGSPGGSTIITQVLEGIMAFIDGESRPQQIVAGTSAFTISIFPMS